MDEPVNKTSPNDVEVHLLDYLIIPAKHCCLIIYTTAAVTALTLMILLLIPNKYTATASLLPPQQNLTLSAQILDQIGARSLFPTAGGMGGMAGNLLGLKSPGDLYVGMLMGQTVSDRVIERFKLGEHYDYKYIEDVRNKLQKWAQITSGKDGIITIKVTDESPQRAADMANSYVEELDKLLQGVALAASKENLAFLDKELKQTTINLARAEETLKTFSEQSNVLQIDAQTKGMLEYIASLRAAIDSKDVQLQVLRQQVTPLNYALIRVETELKGLKEKLGAAEAQDSRVSRAGDTMISTTKVPALGLEYLRLFRDVKFQEGLYQLYCKLAELARMDQFRTNAVVQVIDRATPPQKKSQPKRLMITVLVGVVTLFTMIFVAFIREYWEATETEHNQRLNLIINYLKPLFRPIKQLFPNRKKR